MTNEEIRALLVETVRPDNPDWYLSPDGLRAWHRYGDFMVMYDNTTRSWELRVRSTLRLIRYGWEDINCALAAAKDPVGELGLPDLP